MKVSELAKEFKTTNEHVLEKLKSLKLKAKGGDQELSKAVTIVLKSELIKDMKKASRSKTEKKPARKSLTENTAGSGAKAEDSDSTKKSAKGRGTVKTKEPQDKETEDKKAVKKKVEKVKADDSSSAGKKAEKKDKKSGKKTEDNIEPAGTAPKSKTPEKKTAGDEKVKKTGKTKQPEKKPADALYTGSLDFKVGEAAVPEKRKKFDKKNKPKAKIRSAQPFIPLKPFNKKKKKVKRPSDGMAKQPGVESADLPQPVSAEDLKPLKLRVPITVKDLPTVLNARQVLSCSH